MLSVEAASVTNGCVMRESSTGSLWRLRFSFRFSCMNGLLHWIGESRKDHNCKSQPETSTPPLPRFWFWKLARSQNQLRLTPYLVRITLHGEKPNVSTIVFGGAP